MRIVKELHVLPNFKYTYTFQAYSLGGFPKLKLVASQAWKKHRYGVWRTQLHTKVPSPTVEIVNSAISDITFADLPETTLDQLLE